MTISLTIDSRIYIITFLQIYYNITYITINLKTKYFNFDF